MDIEIRHLKLLQAVSEEGTLTRASGKLHLTQSALSHQLRDIEERLETSLFERGKKMRLTPAGTRLLQSAQSILAELGRAAADVKRAGEKDHPLVRISTECYTCYHWLPTRLMQLQKEFPGVQIHVAAEATRRPLEHLLEERLDLAIVSQRVRNRRVLFEPLFSDELAVILPPGHALARRRFIRAEDFAAENLFLYDVDKENSTLFQEVLFPARVSPKSFARVQLTEAILEMVRAGLGITVMARWAVDPYLKSGALVARRLTQKGLPRQWYAATLRAKARPRHLERFVQILGKYPFSASGGVARASSS